MYKSQQNKMRVIKDKKRQKIYLDLKLNKQKHRSNQMHVWHLTRLWIVKAKPKNNYHFETPGEIWILMLILLEWQ